MIILYSSYWPSTRHSIIHLSFSWINLKARAGCLAGIDPFNAEEGWTKESKGFVMKFVTVSRYQAKKLAGMVVAIENRTHNMWVGCARRRGGERNYRNVSILYDVSFFRELLLRLRDSVNANACSSFFLKNKVQSISHTRLFSQVRERSFDEQRSASSERRVGVGLSRRGVESNRRHRRRRRLV